MSSASLHLQVREVMCVLDLDYICLPCPAEHVVHAPTPKEGRWKMEAQVGKEHL